MSSSGSAFIVALMREVTSNMTNCYGAENWDSERFGPYKSSFKSSVLSKLNGLLAGRVAVVPLTNASPVEAGRKLKTHSKDFRLFTNCWRTNIPGRYWSS